jgi:hypothetical protein
MSVVARRLPLLLLALLAGLGLALVFTADDGGVALERVTTADGTVVDVPAGWVVSPEFDFQYVPSPGEGGELDVWSVAWACPPDDCDARSIEQWLVLAPDLPTFTSARDDDGIALFDLEEASDERSWVLTARTNNELRIVNVAVFADGAERYVACNLVVSGDPDGLDNALIDACRAAERPDN